MSTTTHSASIETEDSFIKYLPYLYEIRKRLLFILTVFFITGALGFIYYKQIITFSLSLFKLEGVNIVFTSPFQFVTLAFTSALLVGTVIILPLIIFQVISFLKPALHSKEYKLVLSLIPVSLILFATGFGFGIIVMRYVVQVFYEKSVELQIGNFLDVSAFLSQVLLTSLMMGVAMQFPIILTILMRFRVIKYHTIEKQRLWAYLASLIFAILLPPTDILSMFLLFLPLAMLYELTLLLNRWLLKSHLL